MTQSLIQAYANKPKRKQIQILGSFFLVLVILIVLLVSYLMISSQVVEMGKDLQKTINQIDDLEYQNALLREKIALKTTNDQLEIRAVELGFRAPKANEMIYIEVPGYQEREIFPDQPQDQGQTDQVHVNRVEYHLTLPGWIKEQFVVFSDIR